MRYRSRGGMGDFFDSFQDALVGAGLLPITASSPIRTAMCAVDPGPAFVAMDAQIDNIKANWNPTGFYTPEDIQAVRGAVVDFATTANDQFETAKNLRVVGISDDAIAERTRVQDLLRVQLVDKFVAYEDAYNKAKSSGTRVINAPGLKDWALDTIQAARNAMYYAALLACTTSVLEVAATTGRDVLQRASDVIMRVVGAAISAGEAVVDAVDWTLTLLKYAKYAAVIGGAYWVFLQIQKSRGSP
jgi:hypothetical protein